MAELQAIAAQQGRADAVRRFPATWPELLRATFSQVGWTLAFPAALVVALQTHDLRLLDYVHVLAAILWTGADLFLGFVLGPVLRRLDLHARRQVQGELLTRTLLYFPVMAATTTTAGWYLARAVGVMQPTSPLYWWFVAALAVVAFLTVQGLGVLLPTNLRVYWEMQRPQPDTERIRRLMAKYIFITGFQGLMQMGIVFIMVRFVVG